MDDHLSRSVSGKVAWRLLPFLLLLYIINILDRVNVGFARLQMLDDLGMSEGAYAFGAGVFYLGYVAFEVPSNLILARVGARRWISRIMISWGLITCAMMTVRTPWMFYLLRILLGFAEAGFFPGIILYMTYWFPTRLRARTVALFMVASPLTGVLGQPLSGAIMQFMDEVGGLRGWQWVFLIEGYPAVVLGLVTLYYLTDRPEQAHWLTAEERDFLVAQIGQEETTRRQLHGSSLLKAMADYRVWLLVVIYFTVAVASNAFGFYLPKLIETRIQGPIPLSSYPPTLTGEKVPGLSTFAIGLLAAIPNLCAMAAMIANGLHSDRTGERRWHVAMPAFFSAIGWAMCPFLESPGWFIFSLAIMQMGIMSMLPTFWSLPTAFLSGTAAAGGIALINSLGNLGGFVAPNILGQFKEVTGSFTGGLLTIAAILVVGGILALCVRLRR
jgi:ACS family tartrate transporter-like MFS transporter